MRLRHQASHGNTPIPQGQSSCMLLRGPNHVTDVPATSCILLSLTLLAAPQAALLECRVQIEARCSI